MSSIIVYCVFSTGTLATWDVGLRGEARVSASNSRDLDASTSIAPSGGVELATRQLLFSARYSPSFSIGNSSQASFFHNAGFSGQWNASPFWVFSIGEQLGYGTRDFSTANNSLLNQNSTDTTTVTTEKTTNGQPPPPEIRSLGYFSSNSSLGLAWIISQNLSLTSTFSFGLSGGINETARRHVPTETSYRNSTTLTWAATSKDSFLTNISNSCSDFTNGVNSSAESASTGRKNGLAIASEAHESWQRNWSGRVSSRVGLGAGLTVSPELSSSVILPYAGMGITYRIPMPLQHIELQWDATFSPSIDRFAGTARHRLSSSSKVVWITPSKVQVSLASTNGISLYTPPSYSSELELSSTVPSRGWELGAGTRLSWQRTSGSTITEQSSSSLVWGVFLTVSYQDQFRSITQGLSKIGSYF